MGNAKGSKSARTRRHLLESGARLIEREGLENLTTRSLAREAEISNGLFTRHFPRKSDFFHQLIEQLVTDAYTWIEELPSGATSIENLFSMARSNVDFFLENPHYLHCLLLFYSKCRHRPELQALNEKLFSRARGRITAYIEAFSSSLRKPLAPEARARIARTLHNELLGGVVRLGVTAPTHRARQGREFIEDYEALVLRLMLTDPTTPTSR